MKFIERLGTNALLCVLMNKYTVKYNTFPQGNARS